MESKDGVKRWSQKMESKDGVERWISFAAGIFKHE